VLKNKRILFIGPRFFGYEKEIRNNLIDFGAEVDFYDDRPANDFFTKLFIRINFQYLVQLKITKYYQLILRKINSKSYDYIFIISPEVLNRNRLQKIQRTQTHSKTILYMWDSFKNKDTIDMLSLFDKIITFDNIDAEKYNLEFLPLFYIKDYEKIENLDTYTYAVSFIGTAHSDRYKIVKSVEQQVKNSDLNIFSFFYLPSSIIFWIRKLFILKYNYGPIEDFSFSSLTQSEIISIVGNSKAVLDINHPLQDGLTSRSIEALGANRKLITTNPNIKKYDFYNANNIAVIDRDNPILHEDFFNTNYVQPRIKVYEKYALKNWLKTIFEL